MNEVGEHDVSTGVYNTRRENHADVIYQSIYRKNYFVSRDNLMVERRTRDRKVASSNPGRNSGKNFLLQSINFVC